MTTRRMGHGMAVSPEKDLELFASMAARGQRLSGISAPGLWLFEPAEPEQAVFAVDYTDRADEDYLALFEAAGWHRVLGVATMQIFKAAPGTRPIHTDPGAEAEALAAQAGRLGRWAAACLAVLAVVALACALTDPPRWITALAVIAAAVPAVYTVIPWLGTRWRLHALRAPRR